MMMLFLIEQWVVWIDFLLLMQIVASSVIERLHCLYSYLLLVDGVFDGKERRKLAYSHGQVLLMGCAFEN